MRGANSLLFCFLPTLKLCGIRRMSCVLRKDAAAMRVFKALPWIAQVHVLVVRELEVSGKHLLVFL